MRGTLSKLGRRCRKGAVMMEYVIVAVLIAAAAVAAVVVFGRSIVGMFNVAGHAAAADEKHAASALTDENGGYRQQLKTNRDEATKINEKFSEVGEP